MDNRSTTHSCSLVAVPWRRAQVFHHQRKFLRRACWSNDVNFDERAQPAEGRCTNSSRHGLLFGNRKSVQIKFTLIPIFLIFLLFTSTSLGGRFLLLFFFFVIGSVRPRVYGGRGPTCNSFLGCFCRFGTSLSFMAGPSIEDLGVTRLGKELARCLATYSQSPISYAYGRDDEKKMVLTLARRLGQRLETSTVIRTYRAFEQFAMI